MRLAALAAFCVLSIAGLGASAHAEGFKHNWRQVERDGAVTFISGYPAPAPFSETGEPEATMTMDAAKAEKGATLEGILKAEVADIREGLVIADYLEEDGHKPDRGIVSYTEEIDGQKVAFIKYRVAGNTNGLLAHPRSVIHAILLKDGMIYYVHLIVLYAGHEDEVRGDQLRLVKAIIRHRD